MPNPVENLLALLGPHMHPPPDRARGRIVLASKKRFLEEGFARITIGELCRTLRVSKKTFYKHFKDKEDLVIAVMALNFSLIAPKMAEIASSRLPPDERLDMFVDFFTGTVAKNISVVFLADLQTHLPEIWEALNAFRMLQVENVLRIVEEGQKQGIFRIDVNPEKLSRLVLLFVSRVVDPKTLYEHGLQVGDVVGIFLDVMRKGIYVRPKRKRSPK